jgi:protein NrfC
MMSNKASSSTKATSAAAAPQEGTAGVSTATHGNATGGSAATAADKGLSRRDFVAAVGGLGVGAVATGAVSSVLSSNDDGVHMIESSEGYLLVDTKKCGACETCMLSCALAHSGQTNLNLSRIQLSKNPLGCFPNDVKQHQCRQCPYPPCVDACPTGANHADEETGVRLIDEGKCIGCERCVEACPFTPSRIQWNYVERHAQKCDLCINTPHWDETGGPRGKQACVEVCPMKAISFTPHIPHQSDAGYEVNLRNKHWAIAGFPIDDDAKILPSDSVPAPAPAGA